MTAQNLHHLDGRDLPRHGGALRERLRYRRCYTTRWDTTGDTDVAEFIMASGQIRS